MEITKQTKSNRKWAIVIGLGLALSPIHNQWLTDLVTKDGEVLFFLPSFGYMIWILATLFFVFVYDNWQKNEQGKWRFNWREIDWGDRKVLISLLVIVGAMGISGVVNGESWNDKLAPLLMGLSLFTLYLAARKLGITIFRVFIPFVIASTIIVVICGLINPGIPTGGLITNYCASAGFLIFGTIVNQGKWQWVLGASVLVGLFFVGALEAVFIVAVLGIVLIFRRDVNRKFIVIVGSLTFLIVLWIVLGYASSLYVGNHNILFLTMLLAGKVEWNDFTVNLLTTGRWDIIVRSLQNFSFIGHGYSMGVELSDIIEECGTVHNLPLIILHQIGPFGALAWTFVTAYCLIKSKFKYAWIAVMAMCVFNHYIWTQFAPFWWALVGISLASDTKSDLIFRKVNENWSH